MKAAALQNLCRCDFWALQCHETETVLFSRERGFEKFVLNVSVPCS